MNILVIGSGGREHALCWKISQSPLVETIFCTAGNAGIKECATCITLDVTDFEAVIQFCHVNTIGLVVIGPEDPLVNGLSDALEAVDIKAFGPSAKAAQLEGSKSYTKALCAEHGIPTAAYAAFDNEVEALAYAEGQGAPIVIKADGLAAGKGVTVAMTLEEAQDAIRDCFQTPAGARIVIEEFLEGEEASFFALVDGTTALPLATAQDHKRVGEGDSGPNTGGMGAYSPASVMTDTRCDEVMRTIINPTIKAMAAQGTPFKGVLYAGLMITKDGPKLIEYNVRFGDPECQVLMMRMKSDIVPLLLAVAEGDLKGHEIQWHDECALVVVMANKGYPQAYPKGNVIHGLEEAARLEHAMVFHAGTSVKEEQILATGGRVLGATALGEDIFKAAERAYHAVDLIHWDHVYVRRDIGWRAMKREVA